MSEQQNTEPWPEGVIARYLTVAGAHVDIRHDMHLLVDTQPNVTIARCSGESCKASLTEKWGTHSYRLNNGSSGADQEACKWAQAHAAECRAMPRPTAATALFYAAAAYGLAQAREQQGHFLTVDEQAAFTRYQNAARSHGFTDEKIREHAKTISRPAVNG